MEHMRDLLNSTLHQSREIDFEIHKTSVNLARINRTFPSLETAVRNMASQCATLAIRDHVHRALPPVSAVLNVHQLVNELGTSLSDSAHSSSHLAIYISRIKRFRQALTLLTNTCKLAIKWLHDLQHTTDHFNVRKTLRLLEELQETEKRCLLDQGILGVAFRVLQDEFRDLLTQNSFPIEVPSSLFSSGDEESDPLPKPVLPLRVVENLQAIMACYSACGNQNQVDQCVSIYVKVRITTVETSLKGLELDYLEMSLSEFDSVQDIEGYVDEWGRHLEFIVKHLLELEYTLCHQVFGQQTAECFSKIALRSGIHRFIKFGNTITKAKKEAIKLFKLLDVFAALDNLRHDFNRFFGGKQCSEIQTQTRDLIKKVVNGASEIFHELPAQVKFQRLTDPPPDGSVPRLVPFVIEYSEELLDDDYQSVLDQVLKIHRSWYNASKVVVLVEVHNIVKSLEVNLDTWAKRYEDTGLCSIFIMNTSWYLSKHVKGTKLGDLMGESFLKRHEDRVEYYTKLYLRESWGKILANNDDIGGFTEAFDEEYKKQSGWVLCDNSLRWKTGRLIAGMIVPVYKRLVEGCGGSKKHVKYSSERVESMVTSMLQPKDKDAKLIDRIKSVFSPTAAASC